jgi:hypothetical protein
MSADLYVEIYAEFWGSLTMQRGLQTFLAEIYAEF